jgi:hypothetical protein
MRTSYRELSKNEFEVSVITDEDGTIVIGIIASNHLGKWNCTNNYFPLPKYLQDTIKDKYSMIECGRSLVEAWQKNDAQRRFEKKLKEIRETEERVREARRLKEEQEEQEYFDSLWDLDTYDPFEGEP